MMPEEFWKYEDVVGTDVLREGVSARQAPTYQAIAKWIIAHGITDVLDVGCNVAALAMFLRLNGYTGFYAGIDTNPHALKVAQLREFVLEGNLRNLEYGEQDYPLVVVKDVVEHLESYKTLAEAFRVAREYVIVGTYLPWTDEPEKIEKHSDGYFANRYRFADVEAFANECGFELIETLAVNETTGWANQVTFWKRKA